MQAPIGEIIIDQFELEDLLRASAEMLGKGSLGTVYKAVLDHGSFFFSLTLDLDLDLVNAIRKPRTRKNSLGLDYQDQLGVRGCSRPCSSSRRAYAASKIPHGNVKSSNILLDKNGVACISDFGLALLLNPVHATAQNIRLILAVRESLKMERVMAYSGFLISQH